MTHILFLIKWLRTGGMVTDAEALEALRKSHAALLANTHHMVQWHDRLNAQDINKAKALIAQGEKL